ncbi:pyruvate dehydrogenase kinase [Lynx pardinus]|uniref:Pyruvate dehydrogenase kinase n=1 Tax=Lynx pardinus TaxID=191816 RepID=A0A485NGV9_LYNPA|nr:pyruvate dehydrogenase kinase [Lynx pardinus]
MKQFLDFGSSNACEKTIHLPQAGEAPVPGHHEEINLLPDRVLSTPLVKLVHSWYVQSPGHHGVPGQGPQGQSYLHQVTDALIIRNRCDQVVLTMEYLQLVFTDLPLEHALAIGVSS